jgi:hypothetical protein
MREAALGLMLSVLLAPAALATGRGVVLVPGDDGVERPLYAESHALLVGISDYTGGWPDLESVPRELEQVQGRLEAQGFQVVKHLDLESESMKRAFEEFIDAHGYQPENRLLFFFSGHGHTWDEADQGYLVPTDAPLPETAAGFPGPEFLRKALHMSQVLAWSRQMTAKHVLFLFDSCFSGTIFKTKSLPPRPPHIDRATALKVRQFITAGGAGEQVPARSVFTPAFVDALQYGWGDLNGDGYISGVEFGLYLQTKVPQHAQQAPQFGKHPDYELSRGDFVFALAKPPPALAPPPAPPAPPPQLIDQPPATPPPPPPVPFVGNVQVNVNVPATVYIGDTEAGQAVPGRPLNRQGVPTGLTRVRVSAPGYRQAEQAVEVRHGQWEQLVFELERVAATATLTVRSNVSGDTVYIDGERRGSTRLDLDLAPGAHTVRVEKEGYAAHEERVELRAGETATVRAHLVRVPGATPIPTPESPAAAEPREPPPRVPDRPRQREGRPPSEAASPQPGCAERCGEQREWCLQRAAPVDVGQCKAEAERQCIDVYRRCRSSASIVGGAVSVEADCRGEQAACERERLARCEPAGAAETAGCEQEHRDCLRACRPGGLDAHQN